jgi:hypothetical protein
MSVAGSLMASKGVQMFFAARPLPGDSSGPASAPPAAPAASKPPPASSSRQSAAAPPTAGSPTGNGVTKTPAA